MRPSLVYQHGVRLACISFAVAAAGPALSFGATTGGSHLAVSLSRPHNYRAGRHPSSVAVADLNGDRKRDLAVANESGTVSVLVNNGRGRFKTRRAYRAGRAPAAVVSADFNGDRKPDLAVANAGGNSVSILLNAGGARFGAKHDFGTGLEPVDVASGDLNGDGRPDLVTANGTISVLINHGDGSFAQRGDYQLPQDSYASSVAISEVNGDRKPDLIVANPPYVSVLFNTGDGTFGARNDYKGDGDSLAIADMNGDGRPDLVTATSFTVSVLLNRGDGSFAPRRNYNTGVWSQSIAVGDLNGDDRPDVVTTDSIPPNEEDCDGGDGFEVSVLPNEGHGRLGRPLSFSTENYDGCEPVSSAIADVTGDRKPDVVTANNFSGTVSVLVNAHGRCAVPDLYGYALAGAKRLLTRSGCRVGRIRYAFSRYPKGVVIAQSPAWGAVLRRGGSVNLVVSRGRTR